MTTKPERRDERAIKSLWHVMIATVGVYELFDYKPRTKTVRRLRKGLAVGLIAFHVDAAICDALDKPTLFQRILIRLNGN
jgi:hypothetical protein